MTRFGYTMLAVSLGAAAGPVQAQVPPSARSVAASAGPVDPARLAAARQLIDILLPPATREQMVTAMMAPMLANVRRSFAESPQFAAAIGSDPGIKATFDQFMAKQEARSTQLMRDALPGMVPAMANAYARRFDLQQLRELRAFFETPTGRAYMQASFTIMNDPDIAAWQRDLTTRSLANIQEDVAALVRQVSQLKAEK